MRDGSRSSAAHPHRQVIAPLPTDGTFRPPSVRELPLAATYGRERAVFDSAGVEPTEDWRQV